MTSVGNNKQRRRGNTCHRIQQSLHKIFGWLGIAFFLILIVAWNKIHEGNQKFSITRCMFYNIFILIEFENIK